MFEALESNTLRRLYAVLFLFCGFCTLKNYMDYDVSVHVRNFTVQTHSWMMREFYNKQYCRFPNLEVRDRSLMRFAWTELPLVCSPGNDSWVETHGSALYIKHEAMHNQGLIECSFTDVFRSGRNGTQYGSTTRSRTKYMLKKSDFVRVNCVSQKRATWSGVLAGMRYDLEGQIHANWESLPPNSLGLNVLVWCVQGVSRNAFMRSLPLTWQYMRDELNAIDMEGYHVFGQSTAEVLDPIFTGKQTEDIKKIQIWNQTSLWIDFHNAGYATALVYDSPHENIITFKKNGPDGKTLDHNMRTFFLEVSREYYKHSPFCLGSEPRHKLLMNYAHDFFKVYTDKPKFLFGFHGELSRDSHNRVATADRDMLQWLTELKNHGHLEKTLLVIMSDHGTRSEAIRKTLPGRQEEFLPMLSFAIPPAFAQLHLKLMGSLRRNSRRLTTPLDLFHTLRNIIGHDTAIDPNRKTQSLFVEQVSPARMCTDVGITPEQCVCLYWIAEDPEDGLAQQAARIVIDKINMITRPHREQCALLELQEVDHCASILPNKDFLLAFYDITGASIKMKNGVFPIQFSTQPVNSVFVATLHYDFQRQLFSVNETDIVHKTFNTKDKSCIHNEPLSLQAFCICKLGINQHLETVS